MGSGHNLEQILPCAKEFKDSRRIFKKNTTQTFKNLPHTGKRYKSQPAPLSLDLYKQFRTKHIVGICLKFSRCRRLRLETTVAV